MSINQINSCVTYFIVSYDESLNRIEHEQMDIRIRYWNESLGVVETRYFDSKFLTPPPPPLTHTTNSYYKAFNNCVGTVSLL